MDRRRHQQHTLVPRLLFLRFIFGVTLMQLAYAHLQTNEADTAEVTKYYGTLGSVSARHRTPRENCFRSQKVAALVFANCRQESECVSV